MQCRKCGTENPDDAQICDSCSYTLTSTPATDPTRKTKPTKKAVLLHGLGIGILYFILILLSTVSTVVLLLTVIVIILNTIKTVTSFKKAKVPFKISHLFIITPIISLNFILVWVLLLSIDASPILNDYTIADLRSAPPECNRSYEILMSLSEKKGPPKERSETGLFPEDVNAIYQVNDIIREADWTQVSQILEEKADDIIRAWENATKARVIIYELNKFGEIADLTEPDLEVDLGFLGNLRKLGFLHQAYARLETQQGNAQIATEELIRFDSVISKLNINARSMITKLVCFACFWIDIQTANFIINNPQTSRESLELLAQHFEPLEIEQTSLRNPLISDYLMLKSVIDSLPVLRRFPQAKNLPFLKRNSSLRVCRNFCNDLIDIHEKQQATQSEHLSVWPWVYPDLGPVEIGSDGQFPWYYRRYNPLGSMLLAISTPALGRVFEIEKKHEVHYDLLQIVLNKRLGKEISLKARAYSDEYIIDVENIKIFSPGPDGIPHNDDDIKLIINPQVLNFKN
jgi:hypothetical protein